MRFQRGTRTLLYIGLGIMIYSGEDSGVFHQWPENLNEADVQINGLRCVVREIPRQPSILAMAPTLFAPLIQVEVERCDKLWRSMRTGRWTSLKLLMGTHVTEPLQLLKMGSQHDHSNKEAIQRDAPNRWYLYLVRKKIYLKRETSTQKTTQGDRWEPPFGGEVTFAAVLAAAGSYIPG